ncbi:hypothetical protein COLO4_01974 [Corchorus olitorius]|uniref:Uncharacterized protein n=1 Tax=Corchorus olitorius TaxID=93759 RepID=A0A1R3L1V2_9ROSI|nr:hypothetical protein COLO4_01974 [Corchorus olitorius]
MDDSSICRVFNSRRIKCFLQKKFSGRTERSFRSFRFGDTQRL